MIRRVLFALCILAAPAAADPKATTQEPSGHGVVEKSKVEVAPAGHAFKQLQVDNPLGDVRVEGYDGKAIMIETRKHAPDEDALDRMRVSLIPDPDGTVRITTTADASHEALALSRSAIRIDLVIRAPRGVRVDAAAKAGTLEVVNMDAGGELDTASGSISVLNVSGELTTHTLSGPTSLSQVFGSVDAATLSSDMQLDTINGDRLIAATNHGQITGRRVRARDVELTTTDGRIQLEAEAALHGHLVVSSLHGEIDVKLHRHGAVIVRARGTKVDLGAAAQAHPDGWMQVAIGQGDEPALVELRSRYATVQFAIVE